MAPRPEILDVPPVEAIDHFQAKGLLQGFDWRDVDASEHLRAFTAAKAMRLDVLEALEQKVDWLISEGGTVTQFSRELEPELRKLGWWGREPRWDPVEKRWRTVQLGSPRRLRIIADTNLRMSYARGHWERIERAADRRPWLRYTAVHDVRTRPQHMAWDGIVLPWNHPFWRTHYPPNGWYCRCSVQQLSDEDLEEFGFERTDPPEGWDRTREWFNQRTDRTYHIPNGIDPGFQHNVGLLGVDRGASARMIAKIDAAPAPLAEAAVGKPWRTRLFRRHWDGEFSEKASWPVATAPRRLVEVMGGRSSTVRFSGWTARKQRRRHKDVNPEDYAYVQQILDGGELFEARGNRIHGYLEIDGRLWRAVVKRSQDGAETYLVSLHKAQPYGLRVARRDLEAIER